MIIKTIKTNGYKAEGIQEMIATFEKAVSNAIGDAVIEHFYYGDKLDMVDVFINSLHYYGSFNLTKNRVSLTGYTCNDEYMKIFEALTYNDECYNGRLFEIANEG